MNISAVNNFKSSFGNTNFNNNEIIEAQVIDNNEAIEDKFSRVADKINEKTPDNKFTKPIKYFIGTSAAALTTFFIFKKGAKTIVNFADKKLPVFDKIGEYTSKGLKKIQTKYANVMDGKSIKSFFHNTTKNIVDKVTAFTKNAENGAWEAYKATHKPAKKLQFEAVNGLKKAAANLAGMTGAGTTIYYATQDKNGNGIPDRWDKKEKVKANVELAQDIINVAAAATNLV